MSERMSDEEFKHLGDLEFEVGIRPALALGRRAYAEACRARAAEEKVGLEAVGLRAEMEAWRSEANRLREELEGQRAENEAMAQRLKDLRRAVRERLPPSFLGAEILGLQAEITNLLDVLAQFVRVADRDENKREQTPFGALMSPWWPKDHACSECAPESGMLVDGFRCALHRARALLGSKKDGDK